MPWPIAFIATRPKSFDEYARMVILVDNRLFQGQREKRGQSTSGYLHFAPTKETIAPKPKPTITVEDPMDIDVSHQIGATDSDREAERAQCQRLGLCYYCGVVGHLVNICLNRGAAARMSE
jgi:hypothetical protein